MKKIIMRNRNIIKKVSKGSLTVETACVMPLILLVLMGLIYLSFFVHNRAWLTAAAYESAISGSMEGIRKNGEVYESINIVKYKTLLRSLHFVPFVMSSLLVI